MIGHDFLPNHLLTVEHVRLRAFLAVNGSDVRNVSFFLVVEDGGMLPFSSGSLPQVKA